MAAVSEHRPDYQQQPKIQADHAQKQETARQRLAAVAWPILDELAALEEAAGLIAAHRDIGPRVDELLRTMQGSSMGKR